MVGRFGRAVLVLLAAAAGVHGQGTCTEFLGFGEDLGVDCRSTPVRTVLPTVELYGNFSVENITGSLTFSEQGLTEIPDGGFDACPYTKATKLWLHNNDITTVGKRAFVLLTELTYLNIRDNAITWMAPTSLDGLTQLEKFLLDGNRLGAFDFGALAPMPALRILFLGRQEGGDPNCDGVNHWDDPDDRRLKRRSLVSQSVGWWSAEFLDTCGASGSPCFDNAVACHDNQTTFPSTPTTTATTIDDGSTSTLGAGAIAGIAVGTVALIGVGVYVF